MFIIILHICTFVHAVTFFIIRHNSYYLLYFCIVAKLYLFPFLCRTKHIRLMASIVYHKDRVLLNYISLREE